MKRSIKESTIATSWPGSPTRERGDSSTSKASESAVGVVVSIMSVPATIATAKRSTYKTAAHRPSVVILIGPTRSNAGPVCTKNKLKRPNRASTTRTGCIERMTARAGTFEAIRSAPQANAAKISWDGVFTLNAAIMKARLQMSFVRGSSLWTGESAAMYCPKPILNAMSPHPPLSLMILEANPSPFRLHLRARRG